MSVYGGSSDPAIALLFAETFCAMLTRPSSPAYKFRGPMCDEWIQLSINHLNFFQFSPNNREIRWFQDLFCIIQFTPIYSIYPIAGRKGQTSTNKFNWKFTSCKIKTGINPNALHMCLHSSYKGESNGNYTRKHNSGLFSIIAIQHSCNKPNANLFFIMWILGECLAARGMTLAGILE